MMKRHLSAVFLAVGAAALGLSIVNAQTSGESQRVEGRTEQSPVTGDQPDFVEPESAGPDINNGRFIAVGGAMEETSTACFRCHGLNGAGDSTGAFPRLADQSAWYLYKSLQDYASERRYNEIMTPIAQALTEPQMEDVAAYYASVEGASYPPPPDVDPLVLQQGAALSAVGSAEQGVQACVNCHGPEGTGLPPSYPYLAGQYASYLELQLRLWKEGRRGGDPLNVMENIAKKMTDEQIKAVSLYFASIRGLEITPDDMIAGGATATETAAEGDAAAGTALGAAPGTAAESGAASQD